MWTAQQQDLGIKFLPHRIAYLNAGIKEQYVCLTSLNITLCCQKAELEQLYHSSVMFLIFFFFFFPHYWPKLQVLLSAVLPKSCTVNHGHWYALWLCLKKSHRPLGLKDSTSNHSVASFPQFGLPLVANRTLNNLHTPASSRSHECVPDTIRGKRGGLFILIL